MPSLQLIACQRCGFGLPRRAAHCPRCGAAHHGTFQRRRLSTSERGYGTAHQRLRAELLPAARGTLCPLCGQPMRDDQPLDLHHPVPLAVDPRASGTMIVHRACNLAARHGGGAGIASKTPQENP